MKATGHRKKSASKTKALRKSDARNLLRVLENAARQLVTLAVVDPRPLDAHALARAASFIIKALERQAYRGAGSAMPAMDGLYHVTRNGCKALEKIHDIQSRIATGCSQSTVLASLKAVAPHKAEWPVLLSPKEDSRVKARDYLTSLGVGTHMLIPVAGKSRISEKNIWTGYAAQLIGNITSCRRVLERHAAKEAALPFHGSGLTEKLRSQLSRTALSMAQSWPHVLKLPRELNATTWRDWWTVAEAMLEADWKANPAKRKQLFDDVKGSAESQIRTKKTDAAARARSLKAESKNLIVKSIREAFRTIALRRQ